MEEMVILVDERDRETGTAEKMAAHREGLLHRAFSVFVFDSEGRLLLQQRALSKYHSGGLWANTCCSHPRQGETVEAAAHRRLQEEMGFDCPLEERFSFIYRAMLDSDLTEHEYDHVLTGTWDGTPKPDPDEVNDWRRVDPEELLRDVREHPDRYTYWFRESVEQVISTLGHRN